MELVSSRLASPGSSFPYFFFLLFFGMVIVVEDVTKIFQVVSNHVEAFK